MNRSVRKLAFFGATPSFDRALYVGAPNIGDRALLHSLLDEALDRRWLTNNGLLVQTFEQRAAELLGVRNFVAVCNATVALEVLLRACSLEGEVIVPSFTFVATAHAPLWLGLTPVFCDIDEQTHTLDPARVQGLIGPQTSAILAVHLWGRACQIEALAAIAREHKLRLLFDAAHAFGVAHNGTMIGGFGDAEVFSFHATKFFNTFEGGAITTNDDELAERVRLMRNFGFAGCDNVVSLGVNGKMNEACAAMGLTSLDSLDAFTAHNRRNHQAYRDGLAGVAGLRLLGYDLEERGNYQYAVVQLADTFTLEDRDAIVTALEAENVMARRYFYPGCHRMEPYRTMFPQVGDRLPVTEHVADRVIVLPTGTAVNEEDVRVVCALLQVCLRELPQIRTKLATGGDRE